MTASMASSSIRHMASPRSIALISPKVSHTLNVLRPHQGESWSPGTVSSLKNSPSLSPSMAHVLFSSTQNKKCLKGFNSKLPKRVKSARKLPWSDGGKHSLENPLLSDSSALLHCALLENDDEPYLPSMNTPDRAEALKQIQLKNSDISVLGKGSFGTVVAASYKGNVVAVKIIQSSPAAKRQISNEMNSLKLKHPNIVSILKVIETDNDDNITGVVIMERVPGYSLQKVIDQGLVQDNVYHRFRYSIQLSSALAYCHERGVLHLDVKPQNVLVDIVHDTCKLCDFGSSSRIESENYSVQGTVGYVAPEVLRGKKPTTAADVYSLGITMWQLISGESPYCGEREHTVIYKVVATGYRPKTPKCSCPEDECFVSLIVKCWSQSSHCRPSIQQVLIELMEEYPNAAQ